MRSRKLLMIFFLAVAVLLAFGFYNLLAPRQVTIAAAGKVVKASGCVQSGVEAGCLILRTADGKNTYNLLIHEGKKPQPGTEISFEGTPFDGMTTCMQGAPVTVRKWTLVAKNCPRQSKK